MKVGGCDEEHRTTGVTIDDLYWNGVEASAPVAAKQVVGPFADPPDYASSP